jgi:hypothetical protein
MAAQPKENLKLLVALAALKTAVMQCLNKKTASVMKRLQNHLE